MRNKGGQLLPFPEKFGGLNIFKIGICQRPEFLPNEAVWRSVLHSQQWLYR